MSIVRLDLYLGSDIILSQGKLSDVYEFVYQYHFWDFEDYFYLMGEGLVFRKVFGS